MNVYTRLAISTLPGDIKVVSILLFIIKSRIYIKYCRSVQESIKHAAHTNNKRTTQTTSTRRVQKARACIPRYPN